jgi:hypothetical protein
VTRRDRAGKRKILWSFLGAQEDKMDVWGMFSIFYLIEIDCLDRFNYAK